MARRDGRLAATVLAWYAASVGAILTCKLVLEGSGAPASLCALQLAFASAACRCCCWRRKMPENAGAERRLVLAIGACYSMGFLLTNAAISIAAPSFVETFKAAEPLSTVLLAAACLGDRERPSTLSALGLLVLGVGCASRPAEGGEPFSALGMLLALASNCAFSARSILTKRLAMRHPASAVASSDVVLFYHVSTPSPTQPRPVITRGGRTL